MNGPGVTPGETPGDATPGPGGGMSPAGPFPAALFDGQSARRHAVLVEPAGEGLRITGPGDTVTMVAGRTLERLPRGPGGDRLARAGHPGWRLEFADGLPAPLAACLAPPRHYGGWIDRIGLGRAALVFAGVSAALVGVVLTAPQWLGPLVPMSVERRIGEALVGDLASATCHTPAGDAALAKLVRAVDLPGQPPVRAQVVKVGMINAVALPGNRIVLFSGLFDELKDPDAVAGVVAHELGHARKRHVMQALLREFGLSLVLAGSSGAMPTQLARVTGLRYSRGAEAEADDFARARLSAAGISPLPTAGFFTRAARHEPSGPWLAMLGSHPASTDRAAAFRAAARPGAVYRPALSPAEWQALARICTEDRRARPLLDF